MRSLRKEDLMPPTPRFTVLSATYNQAHYLEDMLDSVVAQTVDDFELVVVDDGSTDETPQVLASYVDRLSEPLRSRIRVIRTPNGGQTAAFEQGFNASVGEYICLLDSDDRFWPRKMEVIAQVVREHPEAGTFMHPLRVIDPAGRPTGDIRPRKAALSQGDLRAQMRKTARHSATATSGLVLRRDVMTELFPAPTNGLNFAADAYLSFGAACLAPVVALEEPLADYRMQPGSQYLRRMLSPEGLGRQVAFQSAVASRFGLQQVALRNSHFARNRFAHAMYGGSLRRCLQELRRLILATALDPYFSLRQKVMLIGFWTFTLAAGRRNFPGIWKWFQLRQTGWNRVDAAPPGSHPTPPDLPS